MSRRYDSADAKRRILAACVKLFLERGYTNTRLVDIVKESGISAGSFQNIFHTKDGVLTELVDMMFTGQFGAVQSLAGDGVSPAHVYALETALQLALTEMNENLRDIYVEVYSYPDTIEILHRRTAVVLHEAFSPFLPGLTQSDFYEMELGTAGMMRGYMARPCDLYFTLDSKIQRFLDMSLRVFRVPEETQKEILAYVAGVDIRAAAKSVMDGLFAKLSMHFEL